MAKINKSQFFTSLRGRGATHHLDVIQKPYIVDVVLWSSIIMLKWSRILSTKNCGSHNLVWILTRAVPFKIIAKKEVSFALKIAQNHEGEKIPVF